MADVKTLYKEDFVAWSKEQAEALRAAARDGSHQKLDWENLAEETEGLGISQRRELKSQIGTLLVHRLTNERDRQVVERASDELDRSAAEFLPALAPGQAALIGVAFPIPLTLQISPPNAEPDSKGPRFQEQWAHG